MRINFLTYFKSILLLAVWSVVLSCNGTNVDSVTERSCSEADGLWTVMSAQCNGTSVEVTPVTFLFDRDARTAAQTTGRVDCATHFDWLVDIGAETTIFSMTGTGNLSCTQSSLDVNFCSSDVNTCNAGVDITGIRNEFPTCVITADGMSLIRTVNPINNPDSLSYCENGQTEVVQLVQGEYTHPVEPPPPEVLIAYIEVAGPNPLDFGTHPVGAHIQRTITLTNTGNGIATGLRGTGLATPFVFPGVNFPGTGGTCSLQLEVGQSCTVVLEFFPQTTGYVTDNLLVSYNNGSSTVTVNLGLAARASADLAQLVISNGPFYDYGLVTIGNPQTHSFNLTNSGQGAASNITEIGLAAPFQFTGGVFPGLAGTCTTTLAAGASCLMEIEFNPQMTGSHNDILEIQYWDGVNSQSIRRNVFGQGVTP